MTDAPNNGGDPGHFADLGTAADHQTTSPPGSLWLFYLYFRPGVFFRHFVVDASPLLTALCAWLLGMTSIIDWLTPAPYEPEGLSLIRQSWVLYWGVVLGAGAFSGALYFAIGGWWYRQRLIWSGAAEPDATLARRVYLYASQVIVIPWLLVEIAETTKYSSPVATREDDWWIAIFLLFPAWSVWVSYAGARVAFELRRGLALLWLFILPGAFYVLFLAGAAVVGLVLALGAANVDSPLSFKSATMSFDYPGNWWVDVDSEDHDPNAYVGVELWHDAWILLAVHASELTIADELDDMQAHYRRVALPNARVEEEFDRWGAYTGTGRTLSGTADDQPFHIRLFAHAISEDMQLVVIEICADDVAELVLPGFEQIRDTFTLVGRSPASRPGSPPQNGTGSEP